MFSILLPLPLIYFILSSDASQRDLWTMVALGICYYGLMLRVWYRKLFHFPAEFTLAQGSIELVSRDRRITTIPAERISHITLRDSLGLEPGCYMVDICLKGEEEPTTLPACVTEGPEVLRESLVTRGYRVIGPPERREKPTG